MNKRFGFTLAEVLITLGIIGVVAAMTIPNLIANTNGAKFRSQFKKSISTLSQAGLMAQAQYDFDYAGTSEPCTANAKTEHPEEIMTFCSLLNGTLTGQTFLGKVSDIKRSVNGRSEAYTPDFRGSTIKSADAQNYYAYSLADGSIVAFNTAAFNCELELGQQINSDMLSGASGSEGGADAKPAGNLAKCLGFIDVNGSTLPNKEVVCSAGSGDDAVSDKSSSFNVDKPCTVKNDATHMTDIFPVVFHDAIVEPASDAAKYILTTAK